MKYEILLEYNKYVIYFKTKSGRYQYVLKNCLVSTVVEVPDKNLLTYMTIRIAMKVKRIYYLLCS